MPGKSSCSATAQNDHQSIFSRDYPLLCLLFVYTGYTQYTQTLTHCFHTQINTHSYESSFISWLSVLAIFLGGAGLSPSPCSCSLFFAAFCVTQKIKQQSVKQHNFFSITIQLPETTKMTINELIQI